MNRLQQKDGIKYGNLSHDFHTVAARIITHRYEVSSRQRSMIGRDVKNENYGRINLIEKVRNNNENNITYHGCWYR